MIQNINIEENNEFIIDLFIIYLNLPYLEYFLYIIDLESSIWPFNTK